MSCVEAQLKRENPSTGENRRKKQAGKVRAGPARAFVAAILRASLEISDQSRVGPAAHNESEGMDGAEGYTS